LPAAACRLLLLLLFSLISQERASYRWAGGLLGNYYRTFCSFFFLLPFGPPSSSLLFCFSNLFGLLVFDGCCWAACLPICCCWLLLLQKDPPSSVLMTARPPARPPSADDLLLRTFFLFLLFIFFLQKFSNNPQGRQAFAL
jgi:hypothetical protein